MGESVGNTMFMTTEKLRDLQTKCATSIAKNLVECNRYGNKKLDAQLVGAESFAEWKTVVAIMRWTAYKALAELNKTAGKESAEAVNLDEVYTDLRRVLTIVGEVNGVKLYANEALAHLVISASGRLVNDDSEELRTVCTAIREAKKADTIDEEVLEELEARKDVLVHTPDNRNKTVTIQTENSFRLNLEHIIARVIMEQGAKDPAVLLAEEEARKEARRAANKARRQAKRAEAKASK